MKLRIAKIYQWCKEAVRRIGLRVILALAGYILLAVLAVALTDAWIGRLANLNTQIAHTKDTLTTLAQLRANVMQAESIQRGFLITSRPSYIATYDEAVKQAEANLHQLEAQLQPEGNARNAADQDLLKRITADIEGKITEMQMLVSLVRDGNASEAVKVINTDEGLIKMANFLNDSSTLIAAKKQELRLFTQGRDRTMLAGRASVWASILLVLILLVLAVKQLLGEIMNRDRLSKKLGSDVVNFERQLEERTRLLKMMAVDYQYDVERERRKLARELHDELGSILTATKMDISWVLRKIKDTCPEASDKLTRTMRYLDQGIQFKRRVVQDLHPSLLSTFGLIPALKALIESAAERSQWQLDMMLPSETTPISDALGLIAYRLIQETLNNAAKYAEASKMSVHLQIDEQYMKLEMEDNGKGMDMTQRAAVTHGLEGMRHRVIGIGGKLEIKSEPGKGMFTLALIPLEAGHADRREDKMIAIPRALDQTAGQGKPPPRPSTMQQNGQPPLSS
ncbi:MAG TPA: CHASE3 domain-containing protein [Methylophilaceae bacterium]|nr:CHASE3 domain-containing protein [Methylophilaceae bacterium]